MNNHKLNIDDFTKDLISKSEIQQPTPDFTKNVMNQILKDPAVKVRFITNDDKQSNIWLILSMGMLILGFLIYYIAAHGLNLSEVSNGIHTSDFFKPFINLFSKFWGEISLSPYILIAFAGIVFLVIIDKTVVKYLYSI